MKAKTQPTKLQLFQAIYSAIYIKAAYTNKTDPLDYEKQAITLSVASLRYLRDKKTHWDGRVENRLRDLIDVFLDENE